MITLGITGSYSSGKSFVLTIIKKLGYPIFSADDYIDKLYKYNKEFNQEISKIFEQELTKKEIAQIIFANKTKKILLEKATYRFLSYGINKFISKSQKYFPLAAIEIPLLFEKNFQKYCNYSLTVICPEYIRSERALKKLNGNKELAFKIKSAHFPQSKKQSLSNFIINSNLDKNNLTKEIRQIINNILNQGEE